MKKKSVKELAGTVKKPTIHKVDVSATEAERIVKNARGVLVLTNNDHQYQKGDLIAFEAMEGGYMSLRDPFNPINDQLYEVTYVYSGRGVEQGYVVVSIKYYDGAEDKYGVEDIDG